MRIAVDVDAVLDGGDRGAHLFGVRLQEVGAARNHRVLAHP
jgi:hypothetical protein